MDDDSVRGAVFVDRDGVLNEPVADADDGPGRPPRSLRELRVYEGVDDALDALRRARFLVVVVTNQPDVARGLVVCDAVDELNRHLVDRLGLDAVYVCAHDGPDACACRKPLPGLLVRAAADLGIDLGASWSIGDRWVDVAAGQGAGTRSLLLERPWSWWPTSAGAPPPALVPEARFPTLAECVAYVLARSR